MGRKRCHTIQCRGCTERIVLPYRDCAGDTEGEYYWPAGEEVLNFLCTQQGVIAPYSPDDLQAEALFAMAPPPLGATLWKVRLRCDQPACGSVFSVHLKDRKTDVRNSPVKAVVAAQGFIRCGRGHVVCRRLAYGPELILGDLSSESTNRRKQISWMDERALRGGSAAL